MNTINEATADTKVREDDGSYLYGPFISTRAIRNWVEAQYKMSPHIDRTPDGRTIIKIQKIKIGEQVQGALDGVYVRSHLNLKAPPSLKRKEEKPQPANTPIQTPTQAPQDVQAPQEEPKVEQSKPIDPEIDEKWATKTGELKKAIIALNTLLAKIRKTFGFKPSEEKDTDEYRDFLADLADDKSQYTSRQRQIILKYIQEIDKLEELEDNLAAEVSSLEDQMGGSGFEGVGLAFEPSENSDFSVDPKHQKAFTNRLKSALEEVPQELAKKGDLIEFEDGRRVTVVRVTDKAITVETGNGRLETVSLTAKYKIIKEHEENDASTILEYNGTPAEVRAYRASKKGKAKLKSQNERARERRKSENDGHDPEHAAHQRKYEERKSSGKGHGKCSKCGGKSKRMEDHHPNGYNTDKTETLCSTCHQKTKVPKIKAGMKKSKK